MKSDVRCRMSDVIAEGALGGGGGPPSESTVVELVATTAPAARESGIRTRGAKESLLCFMVLWEGRDGH